MVACTLEGREVHEERNYSMSSNISCILSFAINQSFNFIFKKILNYFSVIDLCNCIILEYKLLFFSSTENAYASTFYLTLTYTLYTQ